MKQMIFIKKDDVKTGMYVILPLSWHQHPFLTNQFVVKSASDIDKIKALDLSEIQVDLSRSQLTEAQKTPPPPLDPGAKPRKSKDVLEVNADALISAINDTKAETHQKAITVRHEAEQMMQSLLENPTTENIRAAKKGIAEVVNMILREDETLHYLLNITSHDHYTYTHCVSVGILGVALAKLLFRQKSDHDIHKLGAGFFLHDLGKVGINNDIINKPGKLTDEEMQEMRRHPAMGFKLLHEARQLTEESRIIVMQHHERYDGKGYPKGLRGSEIHIYGRICSIADVYDALTSKRPYRSPVKPFEALKIMRDEMLPHFEKSLFEQFVIMFKAP